MKLYAAPLQGFTEAPWRNFHEEVFGGIDAYYTSNPQLSSSASFLRLNVLSSLN